MLGLHLTLKSLKFLAPFEFELDFAQIYFCIVLISHALCFIFREIYFLLQFNIFSFYIWHDGIQFPSGPYVILRFHNPHAVNSDKTEICERGVHVMTCLMMKHWRLFGSPRTFPLFTAQDFCRFQNVLCTQNLFKDLLQIYKYGEVQYSSWRVLRNVKTDIMQLHLVRYIPFTVRHLVHAFIQSDCTGARKIKDKSYNGWTFCSARLINYAGPVSRGFWKLPRQHANRPENNTNWRRVQTSTHNPEQHVTWRSSWS